MKAPPWTPPGRILSATRPTLPVLGQAGGVLGNPFRPFSDDEAARVLNAARAGGLRVFDTTPGFGHGLSGQSLGGFLHSDPGRGAVISSLVGRCSRPNRGGPP